MPIESLSDYVDITTLKEGDTITSLNGVLICEKYIPRTNHRRSGNSNGKTKHKVKTITYPYFDEHIDTAQLAYNMNAFKSGDLIEITLKNARHFSENCTYACSERKDLSLSDL